MSSPPIQSFTLATATGSTVRMQRAEYRQLSDAIATGDLMAARQAHDRLTRTNPGHAARDDTLARIGASLAQGDLAGARQAMQGLENRAVRMLTELRQKAETPRPATSTPTEPTPPGSTFRITI